MKKVISIVIAIILICTILIYGCIYIVSKYTGDGKYENGLFSLVKEFSFSDLSCLKEWEEKVFKGKVVYTLEEVDSQGKCVKADSDNTASALYYKIKMNIKQRPVISWKWKVEQFPGRKEVESITNKKEEDFAARVYVIFPATFFPNSKAIEYIWAETLAVGTKSSSPYSNNIQVMVLRSGDSADEWAVEKRDIYADYIELFGEAPTKNVGAISFMTDSDSTQTQAKAFYDEITLGYNPVSESEEEQVDTSKNFTIKGGEDEI